MSQLEECLRDFGEYLGEVRQRLGVTTGELSAEIRGSKRVFGLV